MDTAAAAARPDPDQRFHPTVDRGRVPRMGAHPGPAVHRRQQARAVAPQKDRRRQVGHSGPTILVMYRALRWALFLVAPERIHTWVFAFLRAVTAVLPVRRVLAGWLAPHDPVL